MLNPHTQPSSSKDRQVDLSIVSEDDEMDASRRLFTGHDSEPLSAAEGEAVSRLITALPERVPSVLCAVPTVYRPWLARSFSEILLFFIRVPRGRRCVMIHSPVENSTP